MIIAINLKFNPQNIGQYIQELSERILTSEREYHKQLFSLSFSYRQLYVQNSLLESVCILIVYALVIQLTPYLAGSASSGF